MEAGKVLTIRFFSFCQISTSFSGANSPFKNKMNAQSIGIPLIREEYVFMDFRPLPYEDFF